MKKSNVAALKLLILPALLAGIMFTTLNQGPLLYIVGQLAGAIFFMQAFILLHEFGHNSLFKSSWLNSLFGNIISFFVFIPFTNWKCIHELHHKWTGWRDLDPTTEKTFDRGFSPIVKSLVNFSWKFYVPLFSIGYRLGIYWKREKLKRHLSDKDYQKCLISMAIMATFYLTLIILFPRFVFVLILAIYLSLIMTDILSLSQHSHIEIPKANGKQVDPLKYKDQAIYSRSLIFSPAISKYILFNFNHHEAHHSYPGLPCYFLPNIKVETKNAYPFIPWLKKVKSMPGEQFIFTTSSNREGF